MAPPIVVTPNLFHLHGNQITVTYAKSGIDGKPHFQYHDLQQTLNFSGDQVRAVETEIGTLVSVTIHTTVDSGSTSFSVLVPAVNLGKSESANIRAVGVTTLHRFSIVPALNVGQIELYTVTKLRGTAQHVAS